MAPAGDSILPGYTLIIPHQRRRVLDTSEDVFASERRVFLQDVIDRISRTQKLKNSLCRDPRPANYRASIADFEIDDDSIIHSTAK